MIIIIIIIIIFIIIVVVVIIIIICSIMAYNYNLSNKGEIPRVLVKLKMLRIFISM